MNSFLRVRLLTLLVVLSLSVPIAGQQPPATVSAQGGGDTTSTFLWAADDRQPPGGASLEAAARWHLGRLARSLNATDRDIAAADLLRLQQAGEDGVVAHFRQRVGGIDVYGSEIKVIMRTDGRLVAVSGRPIDLGASGSAPSFGLSSAQALAAALSHVSGSDVAASSVSTGGAALPSGAELLQLAPDAPVHMSEPAAAKAVLYPSGDRMIAAYVLEFYAGAPDSSDSGAYRYVVAADDGRVLERRDLTVSEAAPDPRAATPFTYRVFVDSDGVPLDGPQEDFTPHPTGMPDQTQPAFVPPVLATVGGLNGHPVWKSDPWLPADATETNGNNADAYVDHRAPDGLSGTDFRADLTSAGTFDRTYDTSAEPLSSVDQSKAAITNAFYTVNSLHDYWYISGFNEAAGNAQRDNYGRGGVEGDSMRVEVQDNFFGGSRNNANMSTPSDGLRPRMQMFVWTGPTDASLTLTPGGSVPVGLASFGPTDFDITAPVILANDGVAPTANACEPLSPAAVTGRIVLVDRGLCTFVIKAQRVQAAGAVGMIVANNVAGPAPGLGGVDPTITIAVMSISLADGTALKASLTTGPVTAHMFRFTDIERDSALDNSVIAHEWGHYLHHRLSDCGAQQCRAMSEGWGDFVAVHFLSRPDDNLSGTFSAAHYASGGFADPYYGIRRAPYSVDVTKNALTFRHISDGVPLPPGVLPGGPNSEVHNAGEIWASMLWEGFVALQQARKPGRTFDDVKRRMTDYIVDGLQMVPRDATYTEMRDALLAAAAFARPGDTAGDQADRRSMRGDVLELARAFARRGAGTCAVSPPRNSTNLVGVVESYDLKPKIQLGAAAVAEDRSCDNDGILDAGERGRVVIPVMNVGPIEMLNATVTVTTATPGVSFPSGNSVHIASLAPFKHVDAAIAIAIDASVTGIGQLTLEVHVTNGEACATDVAQTVRERINADLALASSRTDDVESPVSAWTTGGTSDVWSRIEPVPFDRAWLGADIGSVGDAQLISPDLVVSASDPLVVTFEHRFSFEVDGAIFFDGGVIEVSRNGGPWEDIGAYASPGYGGVLFTGSGNPLSGRSAFVARNPGFPARTALSLNLGTALAGQTIRLRFRIGTDEAVSDYGWELDNLSFAGITNTPFHALVAETTVCRGR